MTAPNDRAELRARMKRVRAELAPDERARESAEVCARVMATGEWARAECLFIYVSVGDELDTSPLIEGALAQGKRLCVPKCVGRARMLAVEIGSRAELLPGRYGIPEPDASNECGVEPELVLAPGLAFDVCGGRIGYGGGYYDAYMSRVNAYSIGLAYSSQLIKDVPMSERDARMDAVALPCGVIRTKP